MFVFFMIFFFLPPNTVSCVLDLPGNGGKLLQQVACDSLPNLSRACGVRKMHVLYIVDGVKGNLPVLERIKITQDFKNSRRMNRKRNSREKIFQNNLLVFSYDLPEFLLR